MRLPGWREGEQSTMVSHHHTKCHPWSLGLGMGEKKNNSTAPCLAAGAGRTQPSTTYCDSTRSSWCQGDIMTDRNVYGLEREAKPWGQWRTGWSEWPVSHLSPSWYPGLGYCKRPSLVTSSWSSQGRLCWCLQLLLPLRAVQRPVVLSAIWSHVSIQGPLCHGGNADMNALCWHLGP